MLNYLHWKDLNLLYEHNHLVINENGLALDSQNWSLVSSTTSNVDFRYGYIKVLHGSNKVNDVLDDMNFVENTWLTPKPPNVTQTLETKNIMDEDVWVELDYKLTKTFLSLGGSKIFTSQRLFCRSPTCWQDQWLFGLNS